MAASGLSLMLLVVANSRTNFIKIPAVVIVASYIPLWSIPCVTSSIDHQMYALNFAVSYIYTIYVNLI